MSLLAVVPDRQTSVAVLSSDEYKIVNGHMQGLFSVLATYEE